MLRLSIRHQRFLVVTSSVGPRFFLVYDPAVAVIDNAIILPIRRRSVTLYAYETSPSTNGLDCLS